MLNGGTTLAAAAAICFSIVFRAYVVPASSKLAMITVTPHSNGAFEKLYLLQSNQLFGPNNAFVTEIGEVLQKARLKVGERRLLWLMH